MFLLRGKTRCPAEVVPESPAKFGVSCCILGLRAEITIFWPKKGQKIVHISVWVCRSHANRPLFPCRSLRFGPIVTLWGPDLSIFALENPRQGFRAAYTTKKIFFRQKIFDPGENDQFWSKIFLTYLYPKWPQKHADSEYMPQIWKKTHFWAQKWPKMGQNGLVGPKRTWPFFGLPGGKNRKFFFCSKSLLNHPRRVWEP